MASLLGIDVGTSGTKAVLVDESGAVLAQASSGYGLETPYPGWAEQDPGDWWTATQECIAQIGCRPDAIGLTGQMHGSVFLDEAGEIVRPALLWCDQRTVSECEEIERRVGREDIRRLTCNPPLTGFQLPKVLWLRNHEPDNYRRVSQVLLPKDYIAYRLTAAFSSDVSDASGTACFDVGARKWSEGVLGGVDVPLRFLPDVHESWEVIGKTPDGTPVVAGAGDQAAGAVGVGAVEDGIVSLSLGTSGVAFTCIPSPQPDDVGSVHVFCHANGGWHAMGVMLSCGGSVSWVRDLLYAGQAFDEMAQEAASVELGSSGLTFLPYLSGERCPVVDPTARGTFHGLTLSHDRRHMARAVFEGVTVGLARCLLKLEEKGAKPGRIRLTGGGAASPFWRQMVADFTGKECVTMAVDEGPAFGAAVLAGVGLGVWPSVKDAARAVVREESSTFPQAEAPESLIEKQARLYACLRDWDDPSNRLK